MGNKDKEPLPTIHKVQLQQATVIDPVTGLWEVIRDRTEAVSFNRYKAFIDSVFCNDVTELKRPPGSDRNPDDATVAGGDKIERGDKIEPPLVDSPKPFTLPQFSYRGKRSYEALRQATEAFLESEFGLWYEGLSEGAPNIGNTRSVRNTELHSLDPGGPFADYKTDPYLATIRQRLREFQIKDNVHDKSSKGNCFGPLLSRLGRPSLIELIWNYWHEEAMVTQTIKIIALQFQNRRLPAGYTPISQFQVDALRPLSNLVWGWVQGEADRLSVARRAHEYHHQYGLSLIGRATRDVQPSDDRSRFIAAFHELLHKATLFYELADDIMHHADGFPVLNAVRELHQVLAEGAHNQFTDLTVAARGEALMEMWILARPEMREFFGRRIAVPYPEDWMDRVDTMKNVQLWSDSSVTHFHDLAVHGERLLLSVRYGGWMNENRPEVGASWALHWRPEVQRYIHAYQAVTGVNLTAREIRVAPVDHALPSEHLTRRIESRKRALAASRTR
jgi:hypothetical protein